MRRLKAGLHCRIRIAPKILVFCVAVLLLQLRSLCNGYMIEVYDFTDLMLFAQLGNALAGVAVLLFVILLFISIVRVKKTKQNERVTYAYSCDVEDFAQMTAPPALKFSSEAPYGLLTCNEKAATQLPNDVDAQTAQCVTADYANKITVANTYEETALLTCKRLAKDRWNIREYVTAVPIVQLSKRITNVLQLCAYVAMSSLYYVMTVMDLTQNTVINRISCICLYIVVLFVPHLWDYLYTQIKQTLYIYFRK